jgi:gliding motility-associated transport system ATP-binding protein
MAIDGLSFRIDKGEILGFLGPNGAGKSTTMNIITGYLSASDGRVLIDDLDVLEHPNEVKRKIGYLPEQPPLYLDMTVLEYLKFAAEIKSVPKSEIKPSLNRIMEVVKIDDVQHRLIKNLSKGYRQRVGLAQALVGNPEILILDEPTIGLDPKQIIDMRNLIKTLGKDHTIVLSSHILPEISAVCQRVLIINRGKIAASDTPENLSQRIAGKSRLSLRIEGSSRDVKSGLSKVAGVKRVEVQKSPEEGTVDVLIEAEQDRDVRREVFKAMSSAGHPILLMRPMDLSLEDIFLQLTTTEQEVS